MLGILLAVALNCACHKEPNSCKFVGSPGQRFTYEGLPYSVPSSGSIELVAEVSDQCASDPIATKVAADKFGMWTMQLPKEK